MLAPPGLQPFASLFARERSRAQLFADILALNPKRLTASLELLPLFRREVAHALTGDCASRDHPVALRSTVERLTGTGPHLPTHHCAASELTAHTHPGAWTELSAPAGLHLPAHLAGTELSANAGLHLPTHRHLRAHLRRGRIGRNRPPTWWASLGAE